MANILFRGDRLREAREAAGLSQMALALKTKVSLRAISYWEAGDRQPRGTNLQRLATVLHVRPSFFFVENGE